MGDGYSKGVPERREVEETSFKKDGISVGGSRKAKDTGQGFGNDVIELGPLTLGSRRPDASPIGDHREHCRKNKSFNNRHGGVVGLSDEPGDIVGCSNGTLDRAVEVFSEVPVFLEGNTKVLVVRRTLNRHWTKVEVRNIPIEAGAREADELGLASTKVDTPAKRPGVDGLGIPAKSFVTNFAEALRPERDVISKEANVTSNVVAEVVNEEKKEDGTEDTTLGNTSEELVPTGGYTIVDYAELSVSEEGFEKAEGEARDLVFSPELVQKAVNPGGVKSLGDVEKGNGLVVEGDLAPKSLQNGFMKAEEMVSSREVGSEASLVGRDEVVPSQVVDEAVVDNFFKELGDDRSKGDGSVVARVTLVAALEDRNNVSTFPGGWEDTRRPTKIKQKAKHVEERVWPVLDEFGGNTVGPLSRAIREGILEN